MKLGVLVPSSNTALEPLTTAILSSLTPEVTVHFSRFTVTEIALSKTALSQFEDSNILAAARLLADAHVDCIGWSGTSAGWLGLDADVQLCQRIEEATGIRATTSVLGLNQLLEILKAETGELSLGFVTPYLDNVQAAIVQTYTNAGYAVKAESHLNRSVNVKFAEIDEHTLDSQMATVFGTMNGSRKVVSTFCTNLRAAQRVQHGSNIVTI